MKDFDFENDQWARLPDHLKHLPLFTRHFDLFSYGIKLIWAFILKSLFFKFYIRLKTVGTFDEIYKNYPRLIIISNHTSHLDAVSIATSIPLKFWSDLFIAAAKDYFFSNPLFTFFSQHCLGAIPIDRKGKKSEAIKLILSLLSRLERMWLIIFPEGTRSRDGKIHDFKKGVSVFSEKTGTPVLFLYIKGGAKLWPKGHIFAKPGNLEIYVGPVQPPAQIEVIYENFKKWVESIEPGQFAEEGIQDVTS
jgi:1-acyl-sn-glycerol-3-phosphate acyltransferase